MKKQRPSSFVCPNCGADVPGNAKSCPECGSDENTGWSDDTYLDGISLPELDDEPSPEGAPQGMLERHRWLWPLVGAFLLALVLVATLLRIF